MTRAARAPSDAASKILDAGGMLPVGARVPAGERVDTVVARGYRHPVLAGRVVVRLTAEGVAAGDDLEMAVLGFGKAEPRGAVGQERSRPLGFPGWALVHDPKHARYALDVVREFKKEARRARSKPGHAKDGIDKIGERLGKSVPQFLPSFFEEAGRAFIEHGALAHAAMMFGKAREAESVHALDIDEAHRAQAFLEFALAGAVTTKALAQYAKDLSADHDPATAFAHFRELCVKRTLGGMPPWAGMAKELHRLARAAGKDPDAEDAGLIAEVIDSPALVNAAAEFWRAYAEPIRALAATSPAIRRALLELWPTPSSGGPEFDAEWVALLEACDATRALYADDEPAEARPAGSRAAWFDKLVFHTTRNWRHTTPPALVFTVLRKLAPRLVADGIAVSCARRYRQIDLDLAELALELGVAVKTEDRARIELKEWAKEATQPERGRDPVHAVVHPLLGPLLATSVAKEIGNEPFDSIARGKQGLAVARRRWLEAVIGAAETGGLPAIETALETIDKRVTAATFAELPDLHARLRGLDVAPALARSLRGGIIDELGWPALEAAVAELDPEGKGGITLTGAFPTLVLTRGLRAIAIGAAGRLGEHELRLPAKAELHACRWVQGQLLVLFRHDSKSFAYWSSDPDDVIALDGYFYSVPVLGLRSVVLDDGAISEGGRALRAGDRTISLERSASFSDGTTIWRTEWKDREHRLREVSPATGDLGRASLPAFLEAFVADGWKLNLATCYLHPAPGLRSPLGLDAGMLGVRTRQPIDPRAAAVPWQLATIDGARWDGPAAGGFPVELLRLPGDDRRRPILVDSGYRRAGNGWIVEPGGAFRTCRVDSAAPGYSRGQAIVLPVSLWHLLAPRDPGGSELLRAVTDDQARALIASVDAGGKASDDLPIDLAAPDAAVSTQLRAIADPRLRRGIAGLAGLARRFEIVRGELVASRDPARASTVVAAPLDDATLRGVLGGGSRHGRVAGSLAAQIATMCGALFDPGAAGRSTDVPGTSIGWIEWALAPGALVFAAQAFGTPADGQRELARLIELLLATPLVRSLANLRRWTGTGDLGVAQDELRHDVIWRDGNAYFVHRQYNSGGRSAQTFLVFEHAPDGVFRPFGGLAVSDERRAIPLDETTVTAFLTRLAAGAPAWSAEAASAIAAGTGLTAGEAALVWAGFPRLGDTSANFLPKEIREGMGLKAQQAAAARDSLRAIDRLIRLEVMAAAASDPAALWDPIAGGAVERMIARWNARVGKRTAIPDEVLVAADRDLVAPIQPGAALVMIGNPRASAQLTSDGAWGFDARGRLVRTTPGTLVVPTAPRPEGTEDDEDEDDRVPVAAAAPACDLPALHTVAVYLPYLFAGLPVGDALRAQLPVTYQLVLDRLANPDLWLEHACDAFVGDDADQNLAARLAAFAGEDLPAPVVGRIGRGGALIKTDGYLTLFLRPCELVTATDLARMRLYTAQYVRWGVSARDVIAYLRSDELARMMKRVTDTPVPAGGWEQNPLVSAASVVSRARKRLGVSAEAAAVYLQMLTLLWPTPKNVQTWNGWTPAAYKQAIGELVGEELILEAKRERAQRNHFLPGGWEALKAPHPPMETWKVPLYSDERAETGEPKARFQRFIAYDAPHALFEMAWARIEADDPPRYEEVER